ncbi:PEP-CTERM sorting domain-containing protein [Rubritalea tangerina]
MALAMTGILTQGSSAATLVAGTSMGFDLGPTASNNVVETINSLTNGAGETITAGNVLDRNGVVVDDVGVTVLATGFEFGNNDAATEAEVSGQTSNFNDSNLTDWFGRGSNGTAEIRLTGLDDNLSYDVFIGHAFVANTTNTDTLYGALGTDNSGITAVNSHDGTGDTFVWLRGLRSEGTNLTLTIQKAPGSGAAAVSAFTITAVPEPSVSALLGLGGMALILRRRK